MRLLFCADPLHPRRPDPDFAREAEAAAAAGLSYSLVDHDGLVGARDLPGALRHVAPADEQALYRGWMLHPRDYAEFHAALLARGLRLINDPAAYRRAHLLPEGLPAIEPWTPATRWLPAEGGSVDLERALAMLDDFHDGGVIVKDYVKSRKHEWHEACYIPRASDRAAARRVIERFLELQGDDLAFGLVLRAHVPLRRLGTHPRSGMPLSWELRRFYLDGRRLCDLPYWDDATLPDDAAAVPEFADVPARLQSRFFTLDIARADDGEFIALELGDGQVAGLPQRACVAAFYRSLAAALG